MIKDEMRLAAEDVAVNMPALPMRETHYWPKSPYSQIFKSGVLPYRVDSKGRLEYYLFKPAGDKPELGDPGFQIPKGTREIQNPQTGEWVDYKSPNQLELYGEENLESVKVTAIREGIEEIGLPVQSIVSAGEWGQAAFSSATTGALRTMWLYPLQMQPNCQFNEPDTEHANTVAREWFDIQNRSQLEKIRPDHLKIIREIDKVIRKELSNGMDVAR